MHSRSADLFCILGERNTSRIHRRMASICLLASMCLGQWHSSARAASPDCSALLPSETKAYVSTANAEAFSLAWNRSQLGQLMVSPAIKALSKDLDQELRQQWAHSFLNLGITLNDVKQIASGECCAALVWDHNKKLYLHELPASVFLIEVTSKEAESQQLLARIAGDLLQQKCRRSEVTEAGAQIFIFDSPSRKRHETGRYCYFLKDGFFCGCNVYEVAAGIAKQLQGGAAPSLNQDQAFRWVMNECANDAGDERPQARWFVAPVDFLDARRVQRDGPKKPRKKGDPQDNMELLRHQGFGGIEGAGAYVNFDQQRYDIYQRISVYAPRPLDLAARMLSFPNHEQSHQAGELEQWVPFDIASYSCFHWNIPEAFEASSTLVDEFYGIRPPYSPELKFKKKRISIFEDSLRGLMLDSEGPKVDVRRNIIRHLGTRTYVLVDYERPIESGSEQRLFAAQIKNSVIVAAEINKYMDSDASIKRYWVGEHLIWKIPSNEDIEDEIAGLNPKVELDEDLKDDGKSDRPLPGEESEQILAGSYITMAHGYLMISSSLELLRKTLRDEDQQVQLQEDSEFKKAEDLIREECRRRDWSQICSKSFSQTDAEFEVAYESLRKGLKRKSSSTLDELNELLRFDPSFLRAPRDRDGLLPFGEMRMKELPDRLKPNAAFGVTKPDGWFLIGFMMR